MEIKEELTGLTVFLRTCRLSDCNETYVSWLDDPVVKQYLETRFSVQTLKSVCQFVEDMLKSDSSYLFAIISNDSNKKHIGNIKLGPIHPHYSYADISYFIGDKSYWGKGIATEAIKLVTNFAFTTLKLHRVQAGVFEHNIGSIRALEKAGFTLEGRLRKKLRIQAWQDGKGDECETEKQWQDHIFYGILNENFK